MGNYCSFPAIDGSRLESEAVMKLMQANIVILILLVLVTIAKAEPNKYLVETDDAPTKGGYEPRAEGGAGGGAWWKDGGKGSDYCPWCGAGCQGWGCGG